MQSTLADWQHAFGSSVRTLRSRKQMTRKQLAEATGIDERYLGSVERGVANPTLKVIIALAQALEVKPAQLMQCPLLQTVHWQSGREAKTLP